MSFWCLTALCCPQLVWKSINAGKMLVLRSVGATYVIKLIERLPSRRDGFAMTAIRRKMLHKPGGRDSATGLNAPHHSIGEEG